MSVNINQHFTKNELQHIYDDFAPKFKYEEFINNYVFGLKRVRRQLFGKAGGPPLAHRDETMNRQHRTVPRLQQDEQGHEAEEGIGCVDGAQHENGPPVRRCGIGGPPT